LGSATLGAFAFVIWMALPDYNAAAVLGGVFAIWTPLAVEIRRARKLHVYFSQRKHLP
jgi:hypothetical protein